MPVHLASERVSNQWLLSCLEQLENRGSKDLPTRQWPDVSDFVARFCMKVWHKSYTLGHCLLPTIFAKPVTYPYPIQGHCVSKAVQADISLEAYQRHKTWLMFLLYWNCLCAIMLGNALKTTSYHRISCAIFFFLGSCHPMQFFQVDNGNLKIWLSSLPS